MKKNLFLFVKEFHIDLMKFKERIYDMDRRLGSIIAQGFDDCNGTESAFKLIILLGPLLDR